MLFNENSIIFQGRVIQFLNKDFFIKLKKKTYTRTKGAHLICK